MHLVSIQKLVGVAALFFASAMVFGQGESCNNAVALGANGLYQSNGPGSGNGCHQCADAVHADWFVFSPEENGLVNINSCSSSGPKTRLFLYEGACGALNLLLADSSSCASATGSALTDVWVEAGNSYFLEWDDFYGASAFQFQFDFTPDAGCQGAQNIQFQEPQATSVVFTFETGGIPAYFFLEYGPSGFDLGTGLNQGFAATGNFMELEVSELAPDTDYDFYLWEDCDSLFSDTTMNAVTTAKLCPIPTLSMTASGLLPDQATLNWNFAVPGDSFYLYCAPVPFNYSSALEVNGILGTDGPTSVFEGLQEGTEYEVRYAKVCEAGRSDTVFGVAFTTPYFCGPISNFHAAQVFGDSVVLDWETENVSGNFLVEYGLAGFQQGTGTEIPGTVGSQPVSIGGLVTDQAYEAYLYEICGQHLTDTLGPLMWNTLPDSIPNDNCLGAVQAVCGETYVVNTQLATGEFHPVEDCGLQIEGPGVWYRLSGNDSEVVLNFCNSNFDTQVYVFEGSCDDHSCVAANDDYSICSDFQSQVAFDAVLGMEYFIFVCGFSGEMGEVRMELTCGTGCPTKAENAFCDFATEVELGGPDCRGEVYSNECTSFSQIWNDCNRYNFAMDVWFEFHTGEEEEVGLYFEYSPSLQYYFGLYESCDSSGIVMCQEVINTSPIIVEVEKQSTYWVQVWSEHQNQGEFRFCPRVYPDGIEVQEKQPVEVYPNPTSGRLHWAIAGDVRVWNSLGSEVMAAEGVNEINLASFPKGVYVVELIGQGVVKVLRD